MAATSESRNLCSNAVRRWIVNCGISLLLSKVTFCMVLSICFKLFFRDTYVMTFPTFSLPDRKSTNWVEITWTCTYNLTPRWVTISCSGKWSMSDRNAAGRKKHTMIYHLLGCTSGEHPFCGYNWLGKNRLCGKTKSLSVKNLTQIINWYFQFNFSIQFFNSNCQF